MQHTQWVSGTVAHTLPTAIQRRSIRTNTSPNKATSYEARAWSHLHTMRKPNNMGDPGDWISTAVNQSRQVRTVIKCTINYSSIDYSTAVKIKINNSNVMSLTNRPFQVSTSRRQMYSWLQGREHSSCDKVQSLLGCRCHYNGKVNLTFDDLCQHNT